MSHITHLLGYTMPHRKLFTYRLLKKYKHRLHKETYGYVKIYDIWIHINRESTVTKWYQDK